MESRVHGIGRVPIAVALEVRREVVPIGADDIKTSDWDDLISSPEKWNFMRQNKDRNNAWKPLDDTE